MRHLLHVAAIAAMIGFAGCERESKIEKTTTIEGPGGTTTITETKEIESTGEHPPAGPQGEAVPPRTSNY